MLPLPSFLSSGKLSKVIYSDQYGAQWPRKPDDLKIEFHQIQLKWKQHLAGTDCADVLLKHYLAARKLIWPDRYCHRWTELIYEQIIKNAVTIVMGSASSQKTAHITEWNLLDYWVYPNETAVMVTSTTRDKLEDAVWGEYKKLWKEGKKRFSWLAGQMIDFKQRIATDERGRDSEDARDLRKGIFCFPDGTLVDTPDGPRKIEELKTGDAVFNASGVGFVKNKMSRTAERLVRVRLSDGSAIDCTDEHPFLTQDGWKKAIDLLTYDRVFSARETLSLLQTRSGRRLSEQEVLFRALPGKSVHAQDVQFLRETFSALETKSVRTVLQHGLRREVGSNTAFALFEKFCMPEVREEAEAGLQKQKVLLNCLSRQSFASPLQDVWQAVHLNALFQNEEESAFLQTLLAGEMEDHGDVPRKDVAKMSAGFGEVELSDLEKFNGEEWPQKLVPGGHRLSTFKTGRGSGWRGPSKTDGSGQRRQTGLGLEKRWVDGVEILERTGDGRFAKSKGGYSVHNLEVTGHPSYSVNGVIVHNCKSLFQGHAYIGLGSFAGVKQKRMRLQCDELQFCAPTFLDCLPNLRSNTGSGGFKVIGSGNPKHDPNDQLGMVAEPLEGWAAKEGIEKTTVWPIKLLGGVCVNLIGTDSPNFDQDFDKYPGLIGHEYEKIIAHDYGKDSPEYETQIRGRMRIGLEHSRVITRQLCRLHHAGEKAVWGGKPRTRIYGVDPAYGGGDRCIGGWIEFGEGASGLQILRVNPPRILKIVVNPDYPPEEQIADLVKLDLEQNGIPPENCFYDSFGKGTIGFAFARKFGANPPVPVDAGARPTERPVRYDLWLTERDGRRRLKRCDEHYSKFITEMWFSVRETIESEQMCELPEDVMLEGCWREYKTVAGDRIEVEPKDELKERMGKSPDLFDHLAICCEGARRLGFKIKRLGMDVPVEDSTWDWFWKRQDQLKEQRAKHALTF
jgi:hypothetical protein